MPTLNRPTVFEALELQCHPLPGLAWEEVPRTNSAMVLGHGNEDKGWKIPTFADLLWIFTVVWLPKNSLQGLQQ